MSKHPISVGDPVSVNVFTPDERVGTFDFRGGPPQVGDIIEVNNTEGRVVGRRWGQLPDGTFKCTVWTEEVSDG